MNNGNSPMTNELEKNLSHSRAAYLFAVQSLPDRDTIPADGVLISGFMFKNRSQVESMLVEYGWAFYCRYEACLEHFLQKEQHLELSKKHSLTDWLTAKSVVIPEKHKQGLDCYRIIRNSLHHDDGRSFDEHSEGEIHLFPEQMENFYNLFIWISEVVLTTTKPAC